VLTWTCKAALPSVPAEQTVCDEIGLRLLTLSDSDWVHDKYEDERDCMLWNLLLSTILGYPHGLPPYTVVQPALRAPPGGLAVTDTPRLRTGTSFAYLLGCDWR
jgi:hypothetical protein